MTKRKHGYAERIVLLAFLLLPTLAVSLNLDNDCWFLLNHGAYIVEQGFPTVEPFTIHAEFAFIIQQWLFDVILYFLYTTFGKFGVIALVYIAALTAMLLTYKLCLLLSDGKVYLSVLITACVHLLLCLWFMVSRPQIFTYILLLVELLCLERFAKHGQWHNLIPLPFVSLLLINCHSSMWWMLFAFLLPYILETVMIKWRSVNPNPLPKVPIYLVAVLMVLAGFVNPYGYKAVLYVFTSFGNKQINASILEMQAPDVKSINGAIFFVVLALVVCGYALNRKGTTKLRYVLLALGTTLLALMSIKSIPYFLIGTVVPLTYYLKNVANTLTFRSDSKKQTCLLMAFIVLLYAASAGAVISGYDSTKDFPDTKDAVEYLAENADIDEVTLYTGFYEGGYAQHKGFKTYIDPRAEVFLKSNNKKYDVFEEYLSLQSGELHYEEFLKRYSFTHILVTESDLLSVYLPKDEAYTVFYKDNKSTIYTPVN